MSGNLGLVLDKARAVARAMVDRFFDADFKLANLDYLTRGDLGARIGRCYAANAVNQMASWSYFDLINTLCGCILDDGRKAASLANVMRMLEDERIRSGLRRRFSTPQPVRLSWAEDETPFTEEETRKIQSEIASRDQREAEQRFDARYEELRRAWPTIRDHALAKPFLDARNKAIAHYEIVPGTEPKLFDIRKLGLKWGDPAKFMGDAEGPIMSAVVLCASSSYDVGGFKEGHRRFIGDLWDRVPARAP